MFVLMVVIAFLYSGVDGASEWSYSGSTGPEHWADLEGSFCGDMSQSPIDIDPNDVMVVDFADWTFQGYETGKVDRILNNGHSVNVYLEGNYIVSGGGLSHKYKAVQFHFHWGSVNSQGSEHTLNQVEYPAELHIVHYNSDDYDDVNAALKSNDGDALAVLGVFIEVGEENSVLKDVFDLIENVPYKDNETDASTVTLTLGDALPTDSTIFYRYNGSLTTPTCNEVVVWTVFEEPIQISQAQLDVLRSLREGGEGSSKIEDNFRPVQKLNSRTVYYSAASTHTLSFLLSTICLAILALQ